MTRSTRSRLLTPVSCFILMACCLPCARAHADVVDDFTGLQVGISVLTVSNGGKDFNAELASPNTATIGSGYEFLLSLTSGDFGGGSNQNFLEIDIDGAGKVTAVAQQGGFYYGNFYYPENPGFHITLDFLDPNVEVTSATTSGAMPAGSHATFGLDPVVWSFQGEFMWSNSSYQIAFNETNPGPIPVLNLTASSVPEPMLFPAISLSTAVVALRRRRRR